MRRPLTLNLVGTNHYPSGKRAINRALGCKSENLAAVQVHREPDNPHDPNAVVVECQGRTIGYIAKKQAASLATELPPDRFVTGRLMSPKIVKIDLESGKNT